MKMSRLDKCTSCETELTLIFTEGQDVLHCDNCGYEQLKETRERLENIGDTLCTELYEKGVDKALIKDQEIDIEIALRGDALLPLVVEHYIRNAGIDNDLPYRVVPDKKSFLQFRVIYLGSSLNIKRDESKLLGVLLELYRETLDRAPEHDRYIDFNILLEEDNDMNDKSQDAENEVSVDNTDGLSLSDDKFSAVHSMVEERNEASQLGLFKTLKK